MSAKYILRFDDICSTMNWNKWNSIEDILIKHNIKPILAIVPDNKDPCSAHPIHLSPLKMNTPAAWPSPPSIYSFGLSNIDILMGEGLSEIHLA